jgi:transcription initiation factor TFIIIB Brf1 subunit/transcription initiation factor TFIIB
MRCPCCGSEELVWDYKNGAVVCSSCGCIVDIIYVSQPSASGSSIEKPYRFEKRLRRKAVGGALKRFESRKEAILFTAAGLCTSDP